MTARVTGMLGNVVERKRGRKKKRVASQNQNASMLSYHKEHERQPKNGKVLGGRPNGVKVESHKLTEYFPVRRSERKTGKKLEEEENNAMEQAILTCSTERDLLVYTDEMKGRGIRALRRFERNEFVVEYRGDMVEYSEAIRREKKYSEDPAIGSYMYFFEYKNKRWCVDATVESPYKGRLINHSRLRPNLRTKVVEVRGRHRLILIALRTIEEGEELLYNYGERSPETIALNPWLINT